MIFNKSLNYFEKFISMTLFRLSEILNLPGPYAEICAIASVGIAILCYTYSGRRGRKPDRDNCDEEEKNEANNLNQENCDSPASSSLGLLETVGSKEKTNTSGDFSPCGGNISTPSSKIKFKPNKSEELFENVEDPNSTTYAHKNKKRFGSPFKNFSLNKRTNNKIKIESEAMAKKPNKSMVPRCAVTSIPKKKEENLKVNSERKNNKIPVSKTNYVSCKGSNCSATIKKAQLKPSEVKQGGIKFTERKSIKS